MVRKKERSKEKKLKGISFSTLTNEFTPPPHLLQAERIVKTFAVNEGQTWNREELSFVNVGQFASMECDPVEAQVQKCMIPMKLQSTTNPFSCFEEHKKKCVVCSCKQAIEGALVTSDR